MNNDKAVYYIIPTLVVSATDNILCIDLKWWNFGIGIAIIKNNVES